MILCGMMWLVRRSVLPMQASFDPPGLSIAVKKDRAVETLLVMGNKFNVNVLAQGKEKVPPLPHTDTPHAHILIMYISYIPYT